jgi:hypothetical protein
VNPVRLQSTAPPQLTLPLDAQDPIQRVWESFPPDARERILRLLARAIRRILAGQER